MGATDEESLAIAAHDPIAELRSAESGAWWLRSLRSFVGLDPVFQAHPSEHLSQLFARKPYQGVASEDARFLFVGLDANYAVDIEHRPIFADLLAYHEDGPGFWRRHGVHHPFLLPSYKGDGRRYHRTFAKVGFQPRHAELVSFIELLHWPTVGRSNLVPTDLDRTHLQRLSGAVFRGQARYVFLSAGVVRLMVATGMFPQLGQPRASDGPLRVLYNDNDRTVFLHLHFSNYGKFEARLQAEIKEIAALLHRGEA